MYSGTIWGWIQVIQDIQNEINEQVPLESLPGETMSCKGKILLQNIKPAMERLQEAKCWLKGAKDLIENH